jgi:beta-galactosidase
MLHCKVVRRDQALLIEVDGMALAPSVYVTYHAAAGRYRAFRQAGIRIFSLPVYMGDRGINSLSGIRPFRPGAWKAEQVYDFSAAEEDFVRLVTAVPDALILPRVYLDVPAWWERNHPEELSRDYHGTAVRQSFASKIWRDACRQILEAFYAWLTGAGLIQHVIGCQVAAGSTEEWLYHQTWPGQLLDYSEVNRLRFISWLEEMYDADPGKLSAAWNQPLADFADIRLPTPLQRDYAATPHRRNPLTEQAVIDYYHYHSFIVADAIRELCRSVKRISDGHHLAGAFYGYTLEVVSPDLGTHALQTLLDDDHIDFLASPSSYMQARAPGIDWPLMGPVNTVMAHDKLWFIEADVRTHLTRLLKDSMPFAAPDNTAYEQAVWQGPNDTAGSIGVMAKVFGRVLADNIAFWWFDMWGGWFDEAPLMTLVRQTQAVYDQTMKSGGSRQAAEIAVIVSEEAHAHFSRLDPTMRQAVFEQRRELGFVGAPHHLYLMEDLANIPSGQYRLVIFMNAVALSEQQAALIRDRFCHNCKVIVWSGLSRVPEAGATDFGRDDSPDAGEQPEGKPVYRLDRPDDQHRLVLIQEDDYTVVLSGWHCLPADRLRELARLAGVHLYCHSGDVIYASRDYITLHAAESGIKRIYFPEPCDAEWILGKGPVIRQAAFVDVALKKGETILLKCKGNGNEKAMPDPKRL